LLGREGELRLAINREGERDKEIKGRRRERSERDAGKGDASLTGRETQVGRKTEKRRKRKGKEKERKERKKEKKERRKRKEEKGRGGSRPWPVVAGGGRRWPEVAGDGRNPVSQAQAQANGGGASVVENEKLEF